MSWEKGTKGQAENLTKGRDRSGQPVEIWNGTQDGTQDGMLEGTIAIFLSKSRTGRKTVRDRTGQDGTGQSKIFSMISAETSYEGIKFTKIKEC